MSDNLFAGFSKAAFKSLSAFCWSDWPKNPFIPSTILFASGLSATFDSFISSFSLFNSSPNSDA